MKSFKMGLWILSLTTLILTFENCSTEYSSTPSASNGSSGENFAPSYQYLGWSLCSLADVPAEHVFIIQVYLDLKRCADPSGYEYWKTQYNSFISQGKSVADAKAWTAYNMIVAVRTLENQADLDALCQDPLNYTLRFGIPTNPTASCTIRCSAANADPNNCVDANDPEWTPPPLPAQPN